MKRGSQLKVRGASNWDPVEHPRGPDGKFVETGGGFDLGTTRFVRGPGFGQIMRAIWLGQQDNGRRDPTPAPYDVTRPQPDRFSWRGSRDVAQVERGMQGYAAGQYRFDPDRTEDLGAQGMMNDGVKRGPLVDSNGRDVGASIVEKGAKSDADADAELLASELGHVIGAPSPLVYQDPNNRRRLIMEEVRGDMGFVAPDVIGKAKQRQEESGARLAMLDQLTGNTDRHGGNWIQAPDGTVVGIDNGFAFTGNDLPHFDADVIRGFQQEFMGDFYGERVGQWAREGDRISDEEFKSWWPGIQAMRPEFEKRDRLDWHDGIVRNYQQLARERDLIG